MHPLRSFSKLIQFSLLAETISFSLLHLLIPNGGFLFTPHLLHCACQKSLSSPSSPHFPFDSSFKIKVSGREVGPGDWGLRRGRRKRPLPPHPPPPPLRGRRRFPSVMIKNLPLKGGSTRERTSMHPAPSPDNQPPQRPLAPLAKGA